MDNGRQDFQDDVVWDFDWSDVQGASRYHLQVFQPSGYLEIDEDNIMDSFYHNVYIHDTWMYYLEGYTWRVRAFVNGQWGGWSEIRIFNLEPPDTDPPS